MPKLTGLDHLRALAISLVFLFHYRSFGHPDWVNALGTFGWIGVDLFFVLSGFLIAGQLFAQLSQGRRILYGVFFIKRLFRIIPAYLTVLVLYYLFLSLQERPPLAPLWRYLTFTVNFGLDLGKTGTFTHAWSLCIEEQFYIILPIMIILLYRRFTIRKAIALFSFFFAAGMFLRAWSWYTFIKPSLDTDDIMISWYKYIYYPTYTRLDGLLIGVAIAGLYVFYPKLKQQADEICNWILLASLILLFVAHNLFNDETSFTACTFGFTLVSVAFGCILVASISSYSLLFTVKSKITSELASLSYAIYLSHKMIIHFVQTLLASAGFSKNSTIVFLICLLATIMGAYLLRYTIELPFLRLRDKAIARLNAMSNNTEIEYPKSQIR